eukprot:PLAT212.11.p2 GENE.PLAT212.11~~PLAT212.11.p2  ORF type:complete len:793 (+),score=492.36 PLAT212.11:16-2394(+)
MSDVPTPVETPAEEQRRFLREAQHVVKKQTFFMKRAMDGNNLKEAIHYATELLMEMRTALLTPQNYYALYMQVLDELRCLEGFFSDTVAGGMAVAELYEMVQQIGTIVPRLYLLITVGSVYIQTREAAARDILKDLIEMVKGVQHPLRGLFLRNYLSHISKDKLPDIGSEYEGHGGTVDDAIEFVLQNFGEMNKLWSRMQSSAYGKNKKARERERRAMQILVGTNLVRLSGLEGVDADVYEETVLPRVLEQVTNCKDRISQEYLMDCAIQVFPDEFHLRTLQAFLTACTQLQPDVDVKSILISMMNRLSSYCESEEGAIPREVKAFRMFNDASAKIVQNQASMELNDILTLEVALVQFAHSCYPGRLDYINHVLGFCAKLLEKIVGEGEKVEEGSVYHLEQLLSIPLSSLGLAVLDLGNYPAVLQFLPFRPRKEVQKRIARAVASSGQNVEDVSKVDKLFALLGTLISDEPDGPPPPAEDEEEEGKVDVEFVSEQRLVARLVHLMHDDDTDAHHALLLATRKHLQNGTMRRLRHTIPPLLFAALPLAKRVFDVEEDEEEEAAPEVSTRRIFGFVNDLLGRLRDLLPELTLRLYLQAAAAADYCELSNIAYEFLTQSFILYEDELADRSAKVAALGLIAGTVANCINFEEEELGTILSKVAQQSNKLLRKPDQVRMLLNTSHLFWIVKPGAEEGEEVVIYQNGQRVLECLKRALKVADSLAASGGQVDLFLDILDRYAYHYSTENDKITAKSVKVLVSLVSGQIGNMEDEEARAVAEGRFERILAHPSLADLE